VSVCSLCGRENAEDARFCSACGAALPSAAAPAATRKTVTIVFTDVTGSTAMGEGLDPEALRSVMGRYFDAMSVVIERHGGTVEKFIGDAIMAVFGIPQLHEDDALRAVRTAAAMRTRLDSLNDELTRDVGVRIATRTGVNTGEVVAGDPAAGQRLVTGDAVNVAARLEQAAAPGEILLGGETHQRVRSAVNAEALKPLELKGKTDRIPAFRLLEVLPDVPSIERRHDTPLVGRELELTILREQFATCSAQRECRLVTVLGPPGIGKSRLVWELVASRGDAGFVAGRCLPYGDGITYWPLVEIVKQLAGDDMGSLEALVGVDGALIREHIAAVVGKSESAASPEETFWAVRKLFEALAADRPLIAVFEDFEWAEPTFVDLVEYITGFSSGAPILVVVVARADLLERRPSWTAPRPNATALVLQPLTRDESTSLVDQMLVGATTSRELQRRVIEAAEGNPLFLEQMLAMGLESDLNEVRVPATIQALLAARVDRLEPDERVVIERASFEGRLFHRGAVVELVPAHVGPKVGALLLALIRKEFIGPDKSEFTGDDAFLFRHMLIRDAAYAGVPKEMRSELHERYANWLERKVGDRPAEYEEILGYHFEQAWRYQVELGRRGDRARALGRRAGELLGDAGERALARTDIAAATRLLDRALAALGSDHPRENALRVALGDALVDAGELARACRMLEEVIVAAVAAGNRSLEWRARAQRAWTQLLTTDLSAPEALNLAEEAISVLEPLDDNSGLARAWHLAAHAYNVAGSRDDLQRAHEHALRHARRSRDVRLETESMFWLGLCAFFGPTPVSEAAIDCAALAEAAHTPLQQAHARFWAAAVRGLTVGAGEVRVELDEVRRTYRELGLETSWGGSAIACGYMELQSGDPVNAEAVLRPSADALERAGEKGYRTTVLELLSEALLAQGRGDEAASVALECDAIIAPDDLLATSSLAVLKAKLATRNGTRAQADHAIREALNVLEQLPDDGFTFATTRLDLAEVLHAADRLDEARTQAGRALAIAEAKGAVFVTARARDLLAEL
jgi:class 3 adenylate cyclase/tetratricopeptide (TPR) repeat protein